MFTRYILTSQFWLTVVVIFRLLYYTSWANTHTSDNNNNRQKGSLTAGVWCELTRVVFIVCGDLALVGGATQNHTSVYVVDNTHSQSLVTARISFGQGPCPPTVVVVLSLAEDPVYIRTHRQTTFFTAKKVLCPPVCRVNWRYWILFRKYPQIEQGRQQQQRHLARWYHFSSCWSYLHTSTSANNVFTAKKALCPPVCCGNWWCSCPTSHITHIRT